MGPKLRQAAAAELTCSCCLGGMVGGGASSLEPATRQDGQSTVENAECGERPDLGGPHLPEKQPLPSSLGSGHRKPRCEAPALILPLDLPSFNVLICSIGQCVFLI